MYCLKYALHDNNGLKHTFISLELTTNSFLSHQSTLKGEYSACQ
jgi:hypothetical protein